MKISSYIIFAIIFHFTTRNKEMITILQNELRHHQIARPKINQEIFYKRSVTGDMILTRINLAKEKDLKNS